MTTPSWEALTAGARIAGLVLSGPHVVGAATQAAIYRAGTPNTMALVVEAFAPEADRVARRTVADFIEAERNEDVLRRIRAKTPGTVAPVVVDEDAAARGSEFKP